MDEVMAHGGLLVAEMLKRQGVEIVFTLSAGHLASVYDGCVRRDITVMDFRHEQSAAHAAEGWAKVTRRPGVALLTAGPGVTDGITGIANAYMASSPMIVIGGAAPISQWDKGALQELPHLDLLRPITKWARSVSQTQRLAEYTAMAFREAVADKPGPVFLECPMDVLNSIIPTSEAILPPAGERPSRPQGDQTRIERAVTILKRAERPVIFGGTTLWWDAAADSLRTLAERLQAPVFLNGSGRGCLPPDHQLFFSRARRTALAGADVLLLVGTKLDFRLNFGQPPLIPENTKIIWLDTEGKDIGVNRPADVGIHGDVGAIMRQIERGLRQTANHHAWLEAVREAENKGREAEELLMSSDSTPIHPMRLCRELRDVLDQDAYMVGDGGDIVSYGGRVLHPSEPGHWLDAGPMGTLGAGPGFAIAAKLAHPEKQVALLLGDGSFGLNGMEFETMVRHKLPIVGVIGNDGQWATIKHPQKAMLGHSTGSDLAPGIRYDRMVEAFGGYGELVERPEQIRPALERAFASGKPACVNVITDPDIVYNRMTQVAV
ncbi:MAG: acetolactate synthase [Chloroflexi bacterium]|nr:MAG: acetolactate synthase [Chloroflexota bacterium]